MGKKKEEYEKNIDKIRIPDYDFTAKIMIEFIEYTKRVFQGIDYSFIEGISAILEHAHTRLKDLEIDNDEKENVDLPDLEPKKFVADLFELLFPELSNLTH